MGVQLMHEYMCVEWHHDFAEEPVLLYSELNCGRETRKVEVFRDGHMGYADGMRGTRDTVLAEGVMPPVAEINSDSQFSAHPIGKDVFEAVWAKAITG